MPESKVAYLCAEFAVSPELPTFAGGLGVLAADVLHQASDSRLPVVGVSLLYAAGCFNQWLDEEGNPREECIRIDSRKAGLSDTGVIVDVSLSDRVVYLKVWKKEIGNVLLYLLDADIPENSELDRTMAYRLYDGRERPSRLERSLLFGVGAVRALRKLGEDISLWHLNDDHSSFSVLERIRERVSAGEDLAAARRRVKEETVYTTHTPVAAAESVFGLAEAKPALAALFRGTNVSIEELCALGAREAEGKECFSLTVFSMRHSRTINAVSQAHQKISRNLWSFIWPSAPEEEITYVTNGVYLGRWVVEPLAQLYRQYLAPGWASRADDPSLWEKVSSIPDGDFWEARLKAKEALVAEVRRRTGRELDSQALILGFARRLVSYKQPALPLSSPERLASILCNPEKPVYLMMSGKVQPHGEVDLIHTIVAAAKDPVLKGHFIFLENYGLELARLLVSGSDVWLNTPIPGNEACGTSGMKALYNGVLHASTLDGWWVEAFDGENGWEVTGPDFADSLYSLLEKEIVPLYYRQSDGMPKEWLAKVKRALSGLAPRFNTVRMMKEYGEKVYRVG